MFSNIKCTLAFDHPLEPVNPMSFIQRHETTGSSKALRLNTLSCRQQGANLLSSHSRATEAQDRCPASYIRLFAVFPWVPWGLLSGVLWSLCLSPRDCVGTPANRYSRQRIAWKQLFIFFFYKISQSCSPIKNKLVVTTVLVPFMWFGATGLRLIKKEARF